MRVLLTGSSGFIGNYFYNNYREHLDVKTFSFLREKLENINFKNIEAVVHCGALVHKMHEIPYEDYFKANVEQTLNLASYAKKNNVSNFIFNAGSKETISHVFLYKEFDFINSQIFFVCPSVVE